MCAKLWEDRDVRFDISTDMLHTRSGEVKIEELDMIEDTKGNQNQKGKLIITNIRIMWHVKLLSLVNLTIGYGCVQSMNQITVNSKLKGMTDALHILTKTPSQSRFEFIFTSLTPGNPHVFNTVQAVHKAYCSTKLYRDLKLRGALLQNHHLQVLPQEQICSTIQGVWNLSNDQGNLGTFIVTNIRLVWFANTNELFNVSLPYLQMTSIKVRDSKFGTALVIETTEGSGGYILGFKIHPDEKLKEAFKEISSLFKTYSLQPVFGVQVNKENFSKQGLAKAPRAGEATIEDNLPEADVVIENPAGKVDVYAAYYVDGSSHQVDREPVFSEELGVAIESLKPGFTLTSLWEVFPSSSK